MAKTEMRICKGNHSPFLKCQGTVSETDFFTSWSKYSDGKVPYCKKCVTKMYNNFMKETESEKTALYYTLQKIDIPFIQEVFDESIKKATKNTVVSTYITMLHSRQSNKEIWGDFSNTNVDIKSINGKLQSIEEKKQEIDRLEKLWGLQDTEEDYEFLETTFERYTEGVDFVNSQQQDLYRDLCRDRLLLRKINDNRYSGEETIDKVQNRISKTMGILNIDKFKVVKEKSDIERILERQIWEIENTEPAEVVDKNEYKDFLNIESDWGKHILRAMKNILSGSKDYPNISREDG